jgi:TonB family protein
MKKLLLFTTFILSFLIAKASQDTTAVNKAKIFTAVEVNPEFPGGIQNFFDFLAKNIQYPERARTDKTQGKVFISFTIEEDGKLTSPIILRSLSPETDAEAIRLINMSPHWKPGIQNGKVVKVSYTIAITFQLTDNVKVLDSLENEAQKYSNKARIADSTKFIPVDIEPDYPGGIPSFYSYVNNNLVYPKDAVQNRVRGNVRVQFIVEQDGSLSNIKVIKSLTPSTDAEAIRLVTEAGEWKPAKKNHQKVRAVFSMIIYFIPR